MVSIEERLAAVEQLARRMRLSKASLLRLQPGDILVIRIQRPLASSERSELTEGFRRAFAMAGHSDVPVLIICGMDEVNLDVLRTA
jgi:hypothetical protein